MKLLISPPNNPANLKPGDRVRHAYNEKRVGRIVEMLYRQSRAAVRWEDGTAFEVKVELLERVS